MSIKEKKELIGTLYDEGKTTPEIAQQVAIQFDIPLSCATDFVNQTIKDDYFGIHNE